MKITLVQKNSGYRQKFSVAKLVRSIRAAMEHADVHDTSLPKHVAHSALERLEAKDNTLINVQDITEAVLHVLREDKHHDVSDAYEFVSLRATDPHITSVVKRNGKKEHFHPYKLFKSLKKAFAQNGIQGAKLAEELTKEVMAKLKQREPHDTISAADIRETAAALLLEKGYKSVEKSYLINKYA